MRVALVFVGPMYFEHDAGIPAADRTSLHAATSAGLHASTDVVAHRALAGLRARSSAASHGSLTTPSVSRCGSSSPSTPRS